MNLLQELPKLLPVEVGYHSAPFEVDARAHELPDSP
jgi:hypothetical protein